VSVLEKINVVERYKLPLTVRYCTKCVVSNQRPRITFDADGVCNACRFSERKHTKIDWAVRDKELRSLCDRFRRSDGSFDVVVPSSGGKDSAIVAHKLKFEYGMNPLTVTWAPHIYTDIGWQNFQGLIHSGLDNILGTPNGLVHRKLTRLALLEMGEPFQPFIYGQVAFPMQIASKFGIPLIMDGENGDAEYGGASDTEDNPGFSLEDSEQLWFSGVRVNDWLKYGFTPQDLHYYQLPPYEEVVKAKIERHFWSYYKKWVPQEHFYYASKNTGFKPNPDGRSEGTYSKYASLDDRVDGLHFYFMLLKFGIGRATSDAAHEIRDGHLTREEGVALVRRYDTEFPKKHFKEALEYMQLSEEDFWDCVEKWRNDNLWEKVGNEWHLKVQVS
jgi:N-acetyl sugar amidotransferase